MTEKCFSELKMPVQRCTLPETSSPAGPVMEDWVMLSPEDRDWVKGDCRGLKDCPPENVNQPNSDK